MLGLPAVIVFSYLLFSDGTITPQFLLTLAAYTVAAEAIRILRVLHGAQQWPDDLS